MCFTVLLMQGCCCGRKVAIHEFRCLVDFSLLQLLSAKAVTQMTVFYSCYVCAFFVYSFALTMLIAIHQNTTINSSDVKSCLALNRILILLI